MGAAVGTKHDYKHDLDLRRAVDPYPPRGRTAVHIPCIYHEGDQTASLAVYPDGVHCYACGANKPPLRFLADLNGLTLTADHAKVQAIADEILQSGPVQSAQPRKVATEDLAKAVLDWATFFGVSAVAGAEYLRGRGLENRTTLRARLGHTGRAYTIPLYDREGKLFSVKYRRDDSLPNDGATPKYWNQPGTPNRLYYPPLFDWRKYDGWPVVLTEGEYDALALCQHEVPAVTCPTGVNGLQAAAAEALQRHSALVLCLDNDEPGHFQTARLQHDALTLGRVFPVAWLPEWGKDATDAFTSGHGTALLAALRRAYAQALRG